ncbi:MAG: carotenoid biosynthesis protein [Bacteroidales bacterium]
MVKNIFSNKELPKTFFIFYSVGLLLFAIPFSRPLFTALTPLSLLFVTLLVLWHHKKVDLRFIIFSSFVVISSFFIEVAGVRSGKLFGEYTYLHTLGPGILDTPIVIGVNWLMLTFCSAAVVDFFNKKRESPLNVISQILAGAALMVVYDIVVELIAPFMGMWQFKTEYPPLENFVMWFAISLAYHTLLNLLKIKPTGKPAATLFLSQILFFLLVYAIFLIESHLIPSLKM